jgi:hypothetical protein
MLTVREVSRALRYADERPVRAAINRGDLQALKRYDGRRLITATEFARYQQTLLEPTSTLTVVAARRQQDRRRAVALTMPGYDEGGGHSDGT